MSWFNCVFSFLVVHKNVPCNQWYLRFAEIRSLWIQEADFATFGYFGDSGAPGEPTAGLRADSTLGVPFSGPFLCLHTGLDFLCRFSWQLLIYGCSVELIELKVNSGPTEGGGNPENVVKRRRESAVQAPSRGTNWDFCSDDEDSWCLCLSVFHSDRALEGAVALSATLPAGPAWGEGSYQISVLLRSHCPEGGQPLITSQCHFPPSTL